MSNPSGIKAIFRMGRGAFVLLPFLLVVFSPVRANEFKNISPELKEGDVWIQKKRITDTQGKVDKIERSPSGRYLAARRIWRVVVLGDDEGGDPVRVPDHNVVIIDLKNGSIVRELAMDRVAEDAVLTPVKWGKDPSGQNRLDVYAYNIGSAADVDGSNFYYPESNQFFDQQKQSFSSVPSDFIYWPKE